MSAHQIQRSGEADSSVAVAIQLDLAMSEAPLGSSGIYVLGELVAEAGSAGSQRERGPPA